MNRLRNIAGRTITCTSLPEGRSTVPGAGPVSAPMPVPAVAYASPTFWRAHRQAMGLAVASLITGDHRIHHPNYPRKSWRSCWASWGSRRRETPAIGGKGLAIAGISVGASSLVIGAVHRLADGVDPAAISKPSAGDRQPRESAQATCGRSGRRCCSMGMIIRGQYPPRLEELLLSQSITADVFRLPVKQTTRSRPARTRRRRRRRCHRATTSPYIYVPNLNSAVSADTIVLYERMTDHINGMKHALLPMGTSSI